jgi:hypothetical protein
MTHNHNPQPQPQPQPTHTPAPSRQPRFSVSYFLSPLGVFLAMPMPPPPPPPPGLENKQQTAFLGSGFSLSYCLLYMMATATAGCAGCWLLLLQMRLALGGGGTTCRRCSPFSPQLQPQAPSGWHLACMFSCARHSLQGRQQYHTIDTDPTTSRTLPASVPWSALLPPSFRESLSQ